MLGRGLGGRESWRDLTGGQGRGVEGACNRVLLVLPHPSWVPKLNTCAYLLADAHVVATAFPLPLWASRVPLSLSLPQHSPPISKQNIAKYQSDPEIMKVLEKVTEIFSPQMQQQGMQK